VSVLYESAIPCGTDDSYRASRSAVPPEVTMNTDTLILLALQAGVFLAVPAPSV
jgi:hypothetical protein